MNRAIVMLTETIHSVIAYPIALSHVYFQAGSADDNVDKEIRKQIRLTMMKLKELDDDDSEFGDGSYSEEVDDDENFSHNESFSKKATSESNSEYEDSKGDSDGDYLCSSYSNSSSDTLDSFFFDESI